MESMREWINIHTGLKELFTNYTTSSCRGVFYNSLNAWDPRITTHSSYRNRLLSNHYFKFTKLEEDPSVDVHLGSSIPPILIEITPIPFEDP
jgi:hypothetical protein